MLGWLGEKEEMLIKHQSIVVARLQEGMEQSIFKKRFKKIAAIIASMTS